MRCTAWWWGARNCASTASRRRAVFSSSRNVAPSGHMAPARSHYPFRTCVTVRSCRYFGPEVAAARRSVRPVPDRACGSASVRANRVAMRFQCPTPFPTLAITPLRSASIAIWQTLRTAPYRHDRTVTHLYIGAKQDYGLDTVCRRHAWRVLAASKPTQHTIPLDHAASMALRGDCVLGRLCDSPSPRQLVKYAG